MKGHGGGLLRGRDGEAQQTPDRRTSLRVAAARLVATMNDTARMYSPGLKGVLAGETALASVDGENGRLQYRGYPIGELVERGSYAQVAELLWTGDWLTDARLTCAPLPDTVVEVLRRLPASTNAMDALRTAVSAWGR